MLRSLPEVLLRAARSYAKLIINLSLGSAVPVPRQRYFRRWLPDSQAFMRGAWPDERSNVLLDRAHGGLSSTVRWLHDQGHLVVAAAGKTPCASTWAGAPAARYPAYYRTGPSPSPPPAPTACPPPTRTEAMWCPSATA